MDFEEMAKKLTDNAEDSRSLGAAMAAVGAGASFILTGTMLVNTYKDLLEDRGLI